MEELGRVRDSFPGLEWLGVGGLAQGRKRNLDISTEIALVCGKK